MKKIVDLSTVCDLLGVLQHLPKRSVRITAVCRVLKGIAVPRTYAKAQQNDDIVWAQVGLLFGKLQLFEEQCGDSAILHSIRNMEKPMIFYGCANVALPRDYLNYLQGNGDIVVQGTIYAQEMPSTEVNIVRWGVSDESTNTWLLRSVDVHPLDMTSYPEGIRALYTRLQRNSMRDVIKALYNVEGITPCGIGQQVCLDKIVLHKSVTAYWDTQTDCLLRMNEQERSNLIVQDDTLINTDEGIETVGFTTYDETVRGITEKNGRYYYNRTEFYENPEFIQRITSVIQQKKQELASLKLPEMYMRSDIAVRFATNIIAGIKYNWAHITDGLGVLTGSELCEQVFCAAVDRGIYKKLQQYLESGESGQLARMKIQLNLIMGDRELMYSILGYWLESLKIRGVPAIDFKSLHSAVPDITNKFLHNFVVCVCENAETFLLLFLSEILHLNCDLVQVQNKLKNYKQQDCDTDIDIWRLMTNPYMFVYYGVRISMSDMDTLAMIMGVQKRDNVQRTRMVAYMHMDMCDASNRITRGSTVVERKVIQQNLKYQTTISDAEYKSIQASGMQLTQVQRRFIEVYLGVKETEFNYGIADVYTVTDVWGTKYKVSRFMTQDVLNEYCKSPLGIAMIHDGVDIVLDAQLLEKELYCYTRSRILASAVTQRTRVNKADIDKLITLFEQKTAAEWGIDKLTLEYKQRQVAEYVNSTMAAVVGGAGTGKTTSAALLLYVLQITRHINDDEVLFIAPTGKAAVRLKESVKRPTMTIHRACALDCDFDGSNTCGRLSKYKAIFIDESSLISLNVMAALLAAIEVGTYVYFFGDIAQLPAIDIGKPFALMLRYIPCVTLEISKRATVGNLITKNSNILMSSTTAPLYAGSNYIIADIPEIQAAAYVEAICKYHLYGEHDKMWQYAFLNNKASLVTANDLMVVSPIKSKKYSWGCTSLNVRLQTVYNRVNEETLCVCTLSNKGEEDSCYYVGDKVVHLDNQANATRYRCVNENVFCVIDDKKDFKGVMNGELGIIRYIVDGEQITFLGTETDLSTDSEIAKRMYQKRKRKVYMFVEYTDVDIETSQEEKYLICYPLNKKNQQSDTANKYFVDKTSLKSIELAYALTVHKLEGSQAKITICLCYGVQAQEFLNNNLLQTMLTRASDAVYLIGDIKNAFSKARSIDALKMRKSLFDNI